MKRLAFFVALVGLAACSSVTEPLGMEDPFGIPQPFKGKERNDDMIAQAIRVPALVVAVPGGLAEDRAQALRDRVVELAQASDIPALSAASVRAWSLSGEAARIETPAKPAGKKGKGKPPQGAQGVIVWRLADPDGAQRAKFTVTFKAVQETLGEGDLRIVAQDTVNALDAALLRPDTQVSQTITAAVKPAAWVGTVKGAPGDGNQALTRALTGILPMKGVALGDTKSKAQWRIEGVVKVTPGANGQDVVTLTWRVLDANGKEAGSITQENAVPRGRLTKPWREIAGFAAEAAAEGIAQLIQQVTTATQG
ncbi:MAG: hypothetical protein HOP13_06545 [Alphaproteobacteria bacterium]|jgi:uncharacterized lipoprotein YmbA|nr:hypothetical protein [Alphaproteobacteria bacterium]